jgi:hypothetical protein
VSDIFCHFYEISLSRLGLKLLARTRRAALVGMSLRFRFLPARLCREAGNLLALFPCQFIGTGLSPFFAAKLAEFDRSGVLPLRLTLGQFGFTREHLLDELRQLVDVSGAFAFWHNYY